MSSNLAAADAVGQIISVYRALFISNACAYATLTLVFYEYAITLGQEIVMFWKRRFTGATALFLLNRYLLVLSSTLVVIGEGVTSVRAYVHHSHSPLLLGAEAKRSPRCTVIVKTQFAIYFAQYLPWAAFAAMRAYALTGRNWPLAFAVFLLGLVPYGINMVQYGKGLTGIVDPIVGCANSTPGLSQELGQRLTIVSRTTQIASDLLLIGITWRTLPRQVHGMRSTSFSSVFVRHGIIYFVVMLVLNTLHLGLTLIAIDVVPSTPASTVTIFTLPLTAILISRFLLDLQNANGEAVHIHSDYEDVSGVDSLDAASSINFERVIGSLGSTNIGGTSVCDESDDDGSSTDCGGMKLAGPAERGLTHVHENGGIGGFPVPIDRRGIA